MAELYQYAVLTSNESKVWGEVQGHTVRFKEEWFVAQALIRLKVDFSYQVPKYGGSYLRGGTILDFVCYVPPKVIIIRINGKWWHDRRSIEDAIMKARLLRDYRGSAEVIDIDSEDVDTQEKADVVIRKIIRG